MLKITYTDGTVQNINVTGDFFTVTLAEKNGKKVNVTPLEKAEGLAIDLSFVRQIPLHKFELITGQEEGDKVRYFNPMRETENVYAYLVKTTEYKQERKLLRNQFKRIPFTDSKKLVF